MDIIDRYLLDKISSPVVMNIQTESIVYQIINKYKKERACGFAIFVI